MSTVSQSTRTGADSPTGLDDVKEEEPYEEPDEVRKKLLMEATKNLPSFEMKHEHINLGGMKNQSPISISNF